MPKTIQQNTSNADDLRDNRAFSAFSAYSAPQEPNNWPQPLSKDAFHGLTGEIVRTIEPHTEADPAALMIQ
ncbi:MAG: hypothetical protein V3T23_09820, partial [Nitrososphaerales archaeon]